MSRHGPLPVAFTRVWLVLLILIAAFTRIHGVGEYHYNEDEMLHIEIAQGKTVRQVLKFSLYEAHPPLGHILRHYWQEIYGAAWFGRSLSLLFGLLLIPLYYRIGGLLAGQFAGMCAAALTAFSYGAVTQSYIVRNYSIFLFFLSVGFYYYLLWRADRRNVNLVLYAMFAVLACLTHFSAILAVFSIAAYETVMIVLARPPRSPVLIKWGAVNAVIAVIAVFVYCLWTAYGTVIGRPYFSVASCKEWLLVLLLNPMQSVAYVLPRREMVPFIIFLAFLSPARHDRNLIRFMMLSLLALLLATALVGAGYYFPAGTRHNIWVFPCVVPAAGWVLGRSVEAFGGWLGRVFPVPGRRVAAYIVLLSGAMISNPEARFADSEYAIREKDWQAVSAYTGALGRTDVLVMARDNAAMFGSIYPYAGGVPQAVAAMPYRNTQILFSPRYRRISTRETLENIMRDADRRHMLEGVDTIIFMVTDWDGLSGARSVLSRLSACPLIRRQTHVFPGAFSPVVFLEISKEELFGRILPPAAAAHRCLDGEALP